MPHLGYNNRPTQACHTAKTFFLQMPQLENILQKTKLTAPVLCLQVALVETCISDGNLRDALKLVNTWEMQARYPDLKAEYEQRTMDKLLNKSLWSAAAGYAIGKPNFQVLSELSPTAHKCRQA